MAHSPSAVPPPGTEKWIDMAKQDLAKRLGLDPAEIAFIEYRDVVWPDGGLGCPRPGMVYVQVTVDGYAIRLGAGKRVYQYHGGGRRGPFLCESPIQLPPPASQ